MSFILFFFLFGFSFLLGLRSLDFSCGFFRGPFPFETFFESLEDSVSFFWSVMEPFWRSFFESFFVIESFLESFFKSLLGSFFRSFLDSFLEPSRSFLEYFLRSALEFFLELFLNPFWGSFLESFLESFFESFFVLCLRSFLEPFFESFRSLSGSFLFPVRSFFDTPDSFSYPQSSPPRAQVASSSLSASSMLWGSAFGPSSRFSNQYIRLACSDRRRTHM